MAELFIPASRRLEWKAAPNPSLPPLPARPEDCPPSSALGQAVARVRRMEEGVGVEDGRMRRLRAQLDGYKTTVRGADERTDMSAVAAAEAGIRVLERVIEGHRPRVQAADEDVERARASLAQLWGEARTCADQLHGRAPITAETGRDFEEQRAAVEARFRALIGAVL